MYLRSIAAPSLAVVCLVGCAVGSAADLGFGEGSPGDGGIGAPSPTTVTRDGAPPSPGTHPTADAADDATDGALAETAAPEADASGVVDATATPDSGGVAVVVAPASPGGKATVGLELPIAPKLERLTVNACRGTSLRLGPATSYVYVGVRNDGPRDKVVSVWTSRAPGGAALDTIVAAYAGAAPPATDDARLACAVGVEQGCSATGGDGTACVVESGGADWAGLMVGDGRGVTVPASGSVVIYVAAYDAGAAGAFVFSVRTEQLL